MVQTERSKQIKAINRRYIELKTSGFTDTREFQKIESLIVNLPHHEIKRGTNKGTIQISNLKDFTVYDERIKKEVTRSPYTQAQKNKIEKFYANKNISLTNAKARATKTLKAMGMEVTPESVKQMANDDGKIHKDLNQYMRAIYGHETLSQAIHRGWDKPLTQEELATFYKDIYNNEQNRKSLEDNYDLMLAKEFGERGI